MAFQQNSTNDCINPRRQILQQLTITKQMLKQGTAQTINPSAINTPIGMPTLNANPPNQENVMSPITRNALQHANAASFGFFVAQESAFGNNIVAVLPRYPEAK